VTYRANIRCSTVVLVAKALIRLNQGILFIKSGTLELTADSRVPASTTYLKKERVGKGKYSEVGNYLNI
jgi:hypothetical protein